MRYPALLAALGMSTALLLPLVASAAADGQSPASRFKQADTNGDGMISREEAKALPQVDKHFDEIDANHDGQVTSEELRAFHAKMREKRRAEMSAARFKKLDTDGDGRISRAEAQAGSPRLAEHFDEIDTNKDGFLTPDEVNAARLRRLQAAK